jgi:hypothetical protein
MTSPKPKHIEQDAVEARLIFTDPAGGKPIAESVVLNGPVRQISGKYEDEVVTIANGWRVRDSLKLETNGFMLASHETRVRDFLDPEELRQVYYPEIERLVKRESGATRVVIFDHTIRSGDPARQQSLKLREPVKVAHNDYTERSAPQRVRDLLPDEAEELLKSRVAIIQVWQPIGRPVQRDPLAICDAQSIGPNDLITAERRHPGRVGEIYHLAHNSAQRWFYFPDLPPDNAIVFKCYDSMTDGRSRFTAHTSFDDPTTRPDAPARESIEMRTLAFFGPN